MSNHYVVYLKLTGHCMLTILKEQGQVILPP